MVKIKTGDLLKAQEKVIAHQVNCFGVAGGLAGVVFRKYRIAGNDYMQLIDRMQPKALLGMAQFTGQQKDGHIICNLFGQYEPGADYRPDRLEQALQQLANTARIMGWSVALPYGISCGIAGGNWDEVYQIIERTMTGVEVTLYKKERA